jgi:hypothetical protein
MKWQRSVGKWFYEFGIENCKNVCDRAEKMKRNISKKRELEHCRENNHPTF